MYAGAFLDIDGGKRQKLSLMELTISWERDNKERNKYLVV